MRKVDLLKEIISPDIIDKIEKEKSLGRTIKDIQKDIELLGIKGGYDIEQLLTPQDCRRLSYEIERLNKDLTYYQEYSADLLNKNNTFENIIKEVREYIDKEHKLLYIDKPGYTYTKIGEDILEILDKGE